MTGPDEMLSRIVGWLDEVGVRGADGAEAVSSLNRVWIMHRFEELTGSPVDPALPGLAEAETAGLLAEILDGVRTRDLE
jgi:hypothetical protein